MNSLPPDKIQQVTGEMLAVGESLDSMRREMPSTTDLQTRLELESLARQHQQLMLSVLELRDRVVRIDQRQDDWESISQLHDRPDINVHVNTGKVPSRPPESSRARQAWDVLPLSWRVTLALLGLVQPVLIAWLASRQ